MASGPGRIHAEAAVDLPYPRTRAVRESAAYQALVARVTGLLREADAP